MRLLRWRFRRGRAASGLAVALLGAAIVGAAEGCAGDASPGPAGRPVTGYRPAERLATGKGVEIRNSGPRQRLIVYPEPRPRGRVSLLFMAGRPATALPAGGAAWADADGARVVVFDAQGAVAAVLQGAPPGGPLPTRPLFAAAPTQRELWAVEGDGSALVFRDGNPVSWLHPPFPAAAVAGGDGLVVATRTFLEFELRPVRPADPLLWILDREGHVVRTVGTVEVPENGLLGQLVNTGWAAVDRDGDLYFAYALKPEVRRYHLRARFGWLGLRSTMVGERSDGTLRWRSLRPLSGAPRPPHLAAPRGALEPVFTPNQFGVTVGPDGHVYVLGTDRTGAPDHLYVFEDDGTLLRAGAVPRDHALFADPDGHVYALAVTDALARTGEPPRAPFPSFALPELRTGETIALEDYRGRIVVLNFWASWCGPCRLEMPALDAYAGEIDSARVAVIGLNDDVNPDDARAFLAEFGIRYPSVKGQGHLKARYGYRGLPYTVILDRNLRLIRAIYGFGTTIAPIHEVVERELSSP